MSYYTNSWTNRYKDYRYTRINEGRYTMYDSENPEGDGMHPRNRTSFERAWYAASSVLKFVGSNTIRFQFYIYWYFARTVPDFIYNYNIQPLIRDLRRLESDNDRLRLELIEEKHRHEDELSTKMNNIKQLEYEKQDALTRLSEIVSVQLRDNNPNIVDLNDQCRPTKLAEMFSELYDNEWTSVYSTLEKQFGERTIIDFLLESMMDAYAFCETKAEASWSFLEEWFLDMDLPGAQQTSKWLKDSRKAKIRNQVENVEKSLNQELVLKYQGRQLSEAIAHDEMHEYLRKCVELSLLMVTTDPPVMLSCPGWILMFREQPDTGNSLPTIEGYTMQKNEEGGDDHEATNMDKMNTSQERQLESFDKNLYKEYTIRGPLLDFVVWPALLLHKDGPLLSKGIAQGKKKPI